MAKVETQKPHRHFSPSDAERIRQMLAQSGEIICPLCRQELSTDPIAGGGSIETVWRMVCAHCSRELFVTG